MTDNHPTPPPELVEQLRHEAPHNIRDTIITREVYLITAAYRAGADQELEACCEWLQEIGPSEVWLCGDDLRQARRPKPSSLKEQALEALNRGLFGVAGDADTIRRALEQLND